MIIIANVWYWTATGMTEVRPADVTSDGYITRRDAERLLEDAFRRGFERCAESCKQVISETP